MNGYTITEVYNANGLKLTDMIINILSRKEKCGQPLDYSVKYNTS